MCPRLAAVQLGDDVGISGTQFKRYIRLTELIPEILELVDKKVIGFTMAVDISYFDKELKKLIYEYIRK